MTFPQGYNLEPPGPHTLAAMRDLHLNITQAEHAAVISAAVAAAVSTKASVVDQSRAVMRGKRPTVMVPPMGTAAGATFIAGAATARLANAKERNPPANPINVVVVNPNHNKVRWGIYKAHCVPMSKVVEDCRSNTLPPPPIPYNASVESFP